MIFAPRYHFCLGLLDLCVIGRLANLSLVEEAGRLAYIVSSTDPHEPNLCVHAV